MIAFRKRRIVSSTVVVLVSILVLLLQRQLSTNLIETSLFTGSLLVFAVAFLVLFNIRKRFSFLPIGRASTWLQIHIYVGFFTIFLYFLHTGGRPLSGPYETILGLLFLWVAFSGVFGLFLSRYIPRRLTEHGGNITFDQIPEMRRHIKRKTEDLVLESIQKTKKSTIADFFVDRLEHFFIGSRMYFFSHIFLSSAHLNPLLTKIDALRRYLNEEENHILDQVAEYVKEKDRLDYQYSWQWLLKVWLFLHIPFSYSLLIFGIFHGYLAVQFLRA